VSAPAIELENVGKRYWKIQERSLVRSMVPFGAENRSELWALRGADIRIEAGETVGVIGRNGAGKSTLLRLLAGVSQPTEGSVTIRGRVAPLLSVGVGFHPEMTGRENVLVNGMLLGFTKAQIASRFDAIVEFAELADFVDTPVKFYSTGMFMRLGFAVAVHVEPEVLLVDEVLAVGDVGFQLRCLDRMRELKRSGTTIVFVSHGMHAVQLLCPRTVLMHKGSVEFDGRTELAIGRFHNLMAATSDEPDGGPVRILSRELLSDGRPVEDVEQNAELTYRSRVRFERAVEDPGVFFHVRSEDGTLAYSMQTPIGDRWRTYAAGEEADVEVVFHARLGGGGTYHITLDVTDRDSLALVSDHQSVSFYVPPVLGVQGPADLTARIHVDDAHRTDHRWERLEGVPTAIADLSEDDGQAPW
jgi:ABC-type polysaccharide/polyol phosphate transport system ATPase subunit